MNVTVFCSASDVGEVYTKAAEELAALIAHAGDTLVWGGSNTGTMKVIADAAQEAGGKIVGVSVEFLHEKVRPNADEMIVLPTLTERKAQLLARADVIVVLPGGIGTLDEITEVLEFKKQALHDKPIIFLNTSDFYNGLKQQFERMDAEGFLPRPLADYLSFVDTPQQAMEYIEAHGKN